MKYKIILLGDTDVGKTSLVQKKYMGKCLIIIVQL